MINDKEFKDLNEIEIGINQLSKFRKENRKEKIREVGLDLYKTLKIFGYVNVERSFLGTFFNGLPKTTRNRTLNEVISFLIIDKKIKPSVKIKKCIFIWQKPLKSFFNGYGESITNSSLSGVRVGYNYEVASYEFI